MEVSIRYVLGLDVFREADAEVVAGAEHLERSVRWVHISELPDIAYLLKGGELLLTTAIGLVGDGDLQRRFVRELADVGAAGLVIELGRAFDHVPSELIDEAERRNLPVIALRKETRYVEITEQVHSAIINRQYEFLQKAEGINRDFTDLVLSGAGVRHIVAHLSGLVQNPVVLEDSAHQVVEYSTNSKPIQDLLIEWESHSRNGHPQSESFSAEIVEGNPRCAWMPILLRDETWGRLHLLEVDRALDEADRLALDRAAAAVSLALLADRDAAQLADHARGALVSEVLRGGFESSNELFGRAKSLGVDLSGKRLVALIAEPIDFHQWVTDHELSERDRQRLRLTMREQTRRALTANQCVSLLAVDGDRIVAIVGVGQADDLREVLDGAAAEIASRMAKSLDGQSAVIGISREAHPKHLKRAFEEASESVRFGLTVQGGVGPYYFGDLGLHQLFVRLADGPDLARFVESELNSLLEHDAGDRSKLVPTLQAYLDSGGSKSDTSRALGIERRSVYHRLQKIRSLMGVDLDDPDTRARLIVALRGLDFLRMRRRD